MESTNSVNRRKHDRFAVSPMYTNVTVQRVADRKVQRLGGHAYDISERGVRIELDEPLRPGEQVALDLGLPGEDVEVFVSAKVVWVNDDIDDPGPRRSALQFHEFLSDSDRERLVRFLGTGLCYRAA